MDYKRILETVQNLLQRAEYGDKDYRDDEPFRRSGLGAETLSFQGAENAQAFDKALDELWKKDKEVYDTYTKKTFQNDLLAYLRGCKEGEECSVETLRSFFKGLKSKEVKTYKVIYPIFGAEYRKVDPLKIGPFTIFNPEIHHKRLLEEYPHAETILDIAFIQTLPADEVREVGKYTKYIFNVAISVVEEAREAAKANEKALVRLRQFENTIRFMIGSQNKDYDIGVFNFNEIRRTQGVLLWDEKSSITSNLSGSFEIIPLHQFPINDPQYGHDKLWEMLNKHNPSDLEQRIMSAITWVGRGLRDEEPARAYVQYVFALEALLQFQKDNLVSPSITYSISEMSAFIVAEDLENRLAVEDMVKRIYRKRSAIAHGGTHEVDESILRDALWLIKSLITTLTVNEEFKDLKKIDDLNTWVKKQKYSS
ncbi:hypothetical protein V7Z47_22490 [Priestia megaterium]|uniref:hypothetical protein n=1 Tax=Priestia megaterium TaxID=1404 RepID=UPI002FFE689A